MSTLEELRSAGFELHGRLGPPLFVDRAKDDFRLLPESPAAGMCQPVIDVPKDKDGNPVGQVITGPDGGHQFIGYIVHPDSRGKGFCTEAVEIMVDYLFLSKNIVRVQAETNPLNVSSIRVLEKVGFRFEGVRRKVFFSQGKYNDGSMYSVLREEWRPSAPARAQVRSSELALSGDV